nr:RIIa domain-containing protein 1 isoform X3 [Manis javanica]
MATLQGGPLGPLPDPEALSPAQVEQLRNLKRNVFEETRQHRRIRCRVIWKQESLVAASVGFQAALGCVYYCKAYKDSH